MNKDAMLVLVFVLLLVIIMLIVALMLQSIQKKR